MDELVLENRLTRIEAKLDIILDFQRWREKVDLFITNHDQDQAHYKGVEAGKEALRRNDWKKLTLLFTGIQGVGGAVIFAITKFLGG